MAKLLTIMYGDNMEALGIVERVQLSIQIGESHYREFKSALEGPPSDKKSRPLKDVRDNIAKTLVAFANADGGELLVGVEDDGVVSGLPYNADQIDILKNAYKTNVHADTPLPTPMVGTIDIDGKKVLYFNITKGDSYAYLTSDGRCLKRMDLESVPVGSEKIKAERLETESRTWDRQVEPGLTLADLNIDLIREISTQIAYGVTPEKCLQHLGLADFTPNGLKLKRAAALLFAKDVRNYHPGCSVRIMTVNGQEKRSGEAFNIVKDDIVATNVLELIEASWDRLSYALTMHTALTENAKFQQSYLYPQIACREALINAIVHRNYAIQGRGVEVNLYKDRLEIISPGRLLSTISLSDIQALKGVHESRNPLVARVLREVGYVREMGEGIRRIFDVMRSSSLAEPEFQSDDNNFTVTLFHRSMYDPKVKLWLSQFEEFKLTEAQTAVLALGCDRNEFSTQDIIERLGLVDTDKVREIITPLRTLHLVENTLTDNQAYTFSKKNRIPKRSVPRWKVVTPSAIHNDAESSDKPDNQGLISGKQFELFVGGLPYKAESGDVTQAISCAEISVEAVDIPSGEKFGNINKGFCFVTVTSNLTLADVISHLDKISILDKKVTVRQKK